MLIISDSKIPDEHHHQQQQQQFHHHQSSASSRNIMLYLLLQDHDLSVCVECNSDAACNHHASGNS
jgi:hypothetical protein